jgi:hypothetical protein
MDGTPNIGQRHGQIGIHQQLGVAFHFEFEYGVVNQSQIPRPFVIQAKSLQSEIGVFGIGDIEKGFRRISCENDIVRAFRYDI